jgi:hypothetical protein
MWRSLSTKVADLTGSTATWTRPGRLWASQVAPPPVELPPAPVRPRLAPELGWRSICQLQPAAAISREASAPIGNESIRLIEASTAGGSETVLR